MKSVCEPDVKGKKVLVRADLDIPLSFQDENRRIPQPLGLESRNPKGFPAAVEDDFRLQKCLPTLKFLLENDACIIICGHLDRPGGKVVEELRMDPVAEVLSGYLEAVHKVDQVVGPMVEEAVGSMEAGDILLLENLRFDPRERKNDPEFARELASLADIYVNECFSTSHRAHASITRVPELIPAYAGLRLEEEVEKLSAVRENPERPLVFIIGGAKVETKARAVRKLSEYADKILLGGKLMFKESLEDVPGVVFPVDAVSVFDIGPKTVELFKEELEAARTVVWSGPLGKFESADYADGTKEIAQFLTRINADIIVGGGDTVSALKEFGLRDKMGFVSTGGGAMLAFLAGDTLPGLAALESVGR